MTTEEKRAYLEKIYRDRGFVWEMHKTLVEWDLEWIKAYDDFVHSTYLGQRTLDRKTKELLQIVVEAALKADVEQIQRHVKEAVDSGATPQEILEALESVMMPMGMLAFRRGIQAWSEVVGMDPGKAEVSSYPVSR